MNRLLDCTTAFAWFLLAIAGLWLDSKRKRKGAK